MEVKKTEANKEIGKEIKDPELKRKLQEFITNFYESGRRTIDRKDKGRLVMMIDYACNNLYSLQPIYEQIAKALNISIDNTKERLLNYYWNSIENKQKQEIIPLAKRIAGVISSTGIECVNKINLFKGERSNLKNILIKVKELQDQKMIEEFKSKWNKGELVIDVLRNKLIPQVLAYLNQKDNVELEELIKKKLGAEVELIGSSTCEVRKTTKWDFLKYGDNFSRVK